MSDSQKRKTGSGYALRYSRAVTPPAAVTGAGGVKKQIQVPGTTQVEIDALKNILSPDRVLSGEHGIGYAKKQYMAETYGEDVIALMRRIKLAFDPNSILNPGKII